MTETKGRGSWLLSTIAALLLGVFGSLLAVQLRRGAEARFTPDADLLQELAQAVLIEPTDSTEGGWPQWLGPRRDGVAAEQKILTQWPAQGPPLAWQKQIGEGYAAFAVADGRAYTLVREGAREVVLCWGLDDGTEIWRFGYDCPYTNDMGSGPRSTPCLADGKLIAVGATGRMHCLNSTDGALVWQHDLLAEFQAPNLQWGVSFSPLVDGGLVFTNPGGPQGGSLAAFRLDTGELVWQALDDLAGYSSPILATIDGVKQIVFFTGTQLVGVAPASGKLLWSFPWITAFNVNAATPLFIAAKNGPRQLYYFFISSSYGKGCALVEVERDGSGGFTARAVYEGSQMKNHFSTCVRREEHLYGFDDTDLVCLSLRTGAVQWKKSGFQKGSLIRAGDLLVVLGERGKLAIVEASPESYREKASFVAGKRRCWTSPVLAYGRLIVRDEEQVKCFDVRAK